MRHFSRLISEIWIEISVLSVVLVGTASFFCKMSTGAYCAFILSMAWTAYRLCRSRDLLGHNIVFSPVQKAVLIVIFFGVCISAAIRPHSFLDSYSYRFPQMLFWLQEGRPFSIPDIDVRANQMPHVWPFLASVFFVPLGERAVAIPNIISFVVLFFTLYDIFDFVAKDAAKSFWFAVIVLTTPFAVMQAPGNDNVITSAAFIAVSMRFILLEKTNFKTIAFSACAFALACGIKPQYVTLAPIWGIWFLFSKTHPWKTLRFWQFALLAALVFICSPAPTMISNQILHGSYKHPYVSSSQSVLETARNQPSAEKDSIVSSFASSNAALAYQLLAPPFNPLYKKINLQLDKIQKKHPLSKKILSGIHVQPLTIPEVASVGTIAMIAACAGVLLAILRRRWTFLPLAAGTFFVMQVAVLITTPGTLGRSFFGFFIPMMPFIADGLRYVKTAVVACISIFSLVVSILVIIMNPASPLWPAEIVSNKISHPGIRQDIAEYTKFAHRKDGPHELLDHIPGHVKTIGIICQDGEPFSFVWKPLREHRRIIPFPYDADRSGLSNAGVSYLIVKHRNILSSDAKSIKESFLEKSGCSVVASARHTSYIQKGEETWFLLKTIPPRVQQ